MFTRDRSYGLGESALHWQGDGRSGELAYADVRALRLYRVPGLGGDVGLCVLRPKRGAGRKVVLKSAHFRSLGNFENRDESYVPLVRELLKRIAAANPQAQMVGGSSALWWLWLVLSVLTAGIFLILAVPYSAATTSRAVPGGRSPPSASCCR